MLHKRAIFFDRDGTLLIPPAEYISKAEQVAFYPGVPEALTLLKGKGFRRVVITNQAGVGRGIISEMNVLPVHNHMKRLLSAQGADLDAIFYSPYFPAAGHPEHRRRPQDRKPDIGLFEQAARHFQLSLKDSFVVGDRLEDLQAARNIGAKAILVRTGKGAETERALAALAGTVPDRVADDVTAAAVWICRQVCETPLTGKKILFVLAGQNFQEREYLVPRMTLEALGADIRVAGPGQDECVGGQGMRIRPDVSHKFAADEPCDAVVFIGGEGARSLANCKECQTLARRAYEAKRVVAAICVAPSILANAHILSGKVAVAWHTELPNLRKQGARVARHPVARDGNLVTAAGLRDAEAFAAEICAAILGEKKIEMTVASRAGSS